MTILGDAYAERTHCHRGHEFTPETPRTKGRGRVCLPCKRERDSRNQAAWRLRNVGTRPERDRRKHLMRKYGITLEDYDALVDQQAGRCGCCGTDDPGRGSSVWIVDHDHETGAIRGLICFSCNVGIGHLGDTIEGVRRALAYLTG